MPARRVEGYREDWARVAEQVVSRRTALGMTAGDVVERSGGGISLSVLSLIENNRRTAYLARSLAALCRALGWSPDSIDQILRGDEPTEATQSAVAPPAFQGDGARLASIEHRVADLEAVVAELSERWRQVQAELAAEREAREDTSVTWQELAEVGHDADDATLERAIADVERVRKGRQPPAPPPTNPAPRPTGASGRAGGRGRQTG